MKKFFLVMFLLVVLLAGCANKQDIPTLTTKKPVVVILWHSYNSHAKVILDKLISEFNDTVGLEKGIIIEPFAYGTSKELENAIYNSAKKNIGSAHMPHIFSAYPGSAYRVDVLRPLVDLNKYFNPEELAEYNQDFLKEGLVGKDSVLKILPIAKSTEVIYLNKTDWDKFSKVSGYTTKQLQTWEDLAVVAESYHKWSGGKAMFGINPLNSVMSITAQQLATPIYIKQAGTTSFNYDENTARKIWELIYMPHLKGFYETAIYCADGVKSGDLISYLGSSAGAAYFPSEVTLNSKYSYPIEGMILPYPTFKNAKPYSSQRGAGMSITTSDEPHEYAAAEFLKWLTAPKQNIVFSINTGYLPVQKRSLAELGNHTADTLAIVNTCNIATSNMMNTHIFYADEAFEGYYSASTILDNSIFDKIKNDLNTLTLRVQKGEDRNVVLAEMTDEQSFQKWYQNLQTKIIAAINSERK